jgi:hypothetical protein
VKRLLRKMQLIQPRARMQIDELDHGNKPAAAEFAETPSFVEGKECCSNLLHKSNEGFGHSWDDTDLIDSSESRRLQPQLRNRSSDDVQYDLSTKLLHSQKLKKVSAKFAGSSAFDYASRYKK